MRCKNITWRRAVTYGAAAVFSLTTLLAMGCKGFWDPPVSTATTASTTTLAAANSSVAAGASDTLTATVSPSAATGTVTFYQGTTTLGTGALNSGTATYDATFSAAGSESITATYSGDSTYSTSTSSAVTITVTAVSTAALAHSLHVASLAHTTNLVLAPDATWSPTETVHLHNLAGVLASGPSAGNIDGGYCVLYSGTVYLSGGGQSQDGVYEIPGGAYLAPEGKASDLGCF